MSTDNYIIQHQVTKMYIKTVSRGYKVCGHTIGLTSNKRNAARFDLNKATSISNEISGKVEEVPPKIISVGIIQKSKRFATY